MGTTEINVLDLVFLIKMFYHLFYKDLTYYFTFYYIVLIILLLITIIFYKCLNFKTILSW